MWHIRGGQKVHTEFWWENLMERDHLEDLGVAGRIILKWICKKWDEETWTALLSLRIGTGAGSCGYGNETSDFIK